MGLIYKIENLLNKKVYIGLTTRDFEKRYGKSGIQSVYSKNKKHNNHLKNSIEKYGFDVWSIEIILDNISSLSKLRDLEKHYINLYMSNIPEFGYNKTAGGECTADVLKKKVICINDNKVFDSMADAGAYYDISYTAISQCCIGRIQQVYGLQFAYYIEGHTYELKEITNNCYKSVICINTNEIFNTITSAAEKYESQIESIRLACRNHHKGATAVGMQWDFYEEGKSYKLYDKNFYNAQPVICIDTKEVYSSIKEAERKTGLSGISACCRGETYYIGGKQWSYYTDGEEYELKKIVYGNSKAVICVETQKVYDSIVEAEKLTEATNISMVILGERETSGGYHWDFYYNDKEYKLENYIKERVYSNQKEVICLTEGIIYKSISEAQKILGINNISMACSGITSQAGGLEWAYWVDNKPYRPKEFLSKKRPRKEKKDAPIKSTKKVICIDSKEIFNSMKAAAEKHNVTVGAIHSCCIGKSKTCVNMQWSFYEEGKVYNNTEIVYKDVGKAKKQVLCVELNKTYNSISEADKELGISFKNISACCRGKRTKAGGYHWRYI